MVVCPDAAASDEAEKTMGYLHRGPKNVEKLEERRGGSAKGRARWAARRGERLESRPADWVIDLPR